MKIWTKVTMTFDGLNYVLDTNESSWYSNYSGELDLACGATAAQTAAQQQQASFTTQVQQQAGSIFGSDSAVFNDLMSTFQPTIAAGPSQEGFSAAEKSNLDSQAITNSGIAARNAKQSVGETIASEGGGNNAALQSGVNTGIDLSVANSAANNTANQLNTINEQDYQTGRQNYDTAVAGITAAPNAFNSATTAANATTSAGEASANTANQIATQNNSWIQSVTGALGGIAGGIATGGMKNLGAGAGFFGGNT